MKGTEKLLLREGTSVLTGLITVLKWIKWSAPGKNSRSHNIHVHPSVNTNIHTDAIART